MRPPMRLFRLPREKWLCRTGDLRAANSREKCSIVAHFLNETQSMVAFFEFLWKFLKKPIDWV